MAGPVEVIKPQVPLLNKELRAQRISLMFDDFQAKRIDWAREAAVDEDFFLGNQWTQKQVEELGERGMAPLCINRTMPVILQETAILTSRSPSFKAYQRDDTDVKKAAVWSDVFSYLWQNSHGDLERQTTILDYFQKGAGYYHSYVDPYADDGRGEVMIENLPVWDVYPDPNSRKIDLRDARAIIISRIVDEASLFYMFPNRTREIRMAAAEFGANADRPPTNPALIFSGTTPDAGTSWATN